MNWKSEACRAAYLCGDVTVGAVYPPVSGGRNWRWRIWVTSRLHPQIGTARNEQAARQAVEERFKAFLGAAKLTPKGGAS